MTTFNPSSLNNSLLASLTRAASYFVSQMTAKVGENNLPSVISDATEIEPAQLLTDGLAYIDITIDLDKAPMAAAFEWGSGLHDPGGAHLIPIAAKNAPNLAFWWERGNKWFVGKQLPYGHPGVAARPYIEPTIRETQAEIAKMLGQDFIASVFIGGTLKVMV